MQGVVIGDLFFLLVHGLAQTLPDLAFGVLASDRLVLLVGAVDDGARVL
ncbi:hypothetical protein [Candidatus Nitrospira neomarina]|uniref:Uncharacterized protein n=1 Tax=Candidatus Nitrospira neomarina TaxID=3020899 RepID=A0AA96GL41_9BACT|nr:hypothetical protein [Candidatus Nitrospira neomarina]WNM62270.1 hypothetical protein PQG83_00565 [Candidatus Nitrospira neomarina]